MKRISNRGRGTSRLLANQQRLVRARKPLIAAVEQVELRRLLSTVTGTVYNDLNRSGRLDAGEPGLAGRTVFADYNYNGQLDASEPRALTNAAGNYSLATRAQQVSLRVSINAGEEVSLGYGATSLWVPTVNGTVSGRHFGIVPIRPAPSVSGRVFEDLNNNGVFDAGEAGLADRTVFADYNYNRELDAGEPFALTDANGRYTLATRGQHVSLTIVTKPGETLSLGYGATSLWLPVVNGAVTGKDFGLIAQPTLVDLVFFPDYNGNGVRDAGEEGSLIEYAESHFSGWFDLDGNATQDLAAGEWSIPTQTQTGGWQSFFIYLPPGTYPFQVRTSDPASSLSPGGSITITVGTDQSSYEIGVQGVGLVRTQLFADTNNNGQLDSDAGEHPFLDFEEFWRTHNVFMDRNGDGIQQSGEPSFYGNHYTGDGPRWAHFGTYTAAGLLPGEVFTTPRTIVVGPSTPLPSYIGIGQAPKSVIEGIVFFDANRDGRKDSAEAGLANRTVFADYNYNGILDTDEPRALTNTAGHYSLPTRPQHVSLRVVLNASEQVSLGYGATSLWVAEVNGTVVGKNFGIAANA